MTVAKGHVITCPFEIHGPREGRHRFPIGFSHRTPPNPASTWSPAICFSVRSCRSRYSVLRSSGENGTSRSFCPFPNTFQHHVVEVDVAIAQPAGLANTQAYQTRVRGVTFLRKVRSRRNWSKSVARGWFMDHSRPAVRRTFLRSMSFLSVR